MANKYAFIDLENIQPASLQKLKNENYQLKVFVGANQAKISVELAEEIQQFGENAQYIRLQNSGKNALDFHIAFYLGQLSKDEIGCQFLVISKDTGYDPLLKHMRDLGIKANRSAAAVNAPTPPTQPTPPRNSASQKTPAQMTIAERIKFARHYLQKAGKAKPAKRKTLATALASIFQKSLSDLMIDDLIHELCKQGVVIDNQGSITYKLNA